METKKHALAPMLASPIADTFCKVPENRVTPAQIVAGEDLHPGATTSAMNRLGPVDLKYSPKSGFWITPKPASDSAWQEVHKLKTTATFLDKKLASFREDKALQDELGSEFQEMMFGMAKAVGWYEMRTFHRKAQAFADSIWFDDTSKFDAPGIASIAKRAMASGYAQGAYIPSYGLEESKLYNLDTPFDAILNDMKLRRNTQV